MIAATAESNVQVTGPSPEYAWMFFLGTTQDAISAIPVHYLRNVTVNLGTGLSFTSSGNGFLETGRPKALIMCRWAE